MTSDNDIRHATAQADAFAGETADEQGLSRPYVHRHGLAKIVTNEGDGEYTVTAQVWDATASEWEDTLDEGLIAVTARAMLDDASGAANGMVHFWEQDTAEGAVEVLIHIPSVALPVGAIILWSGTIASIADITPGTWKICDGDNGTPNLTDRFVIHADGTTRTVGASGGSHNTAAHSVDNNTAQGHVLDASGSAIAGGPSGTDYGLDNHPAHSHDLTNNHTNNGDNMPKWYALAYIMRTA